MRKIRLGVFLRNTDFLMTFIEKSVALSNRRGTKSACPGQFTLASSGAGIEGRGEDLADPFLDDRSFRAWRTSEEQTIDPSFERWLSGARAGSRTPYRARTLSNFLTSARD